mmetsp:Transcript_64498/g.170785  ORF Transcript_64498/g.170785 Transcript_64498/m.170785 type:complete len:153 (-) Transcript_64498:78-536(-)
MFASMMRLVMFIPAAISVAVQIRGSLRSVALGDSSMVDESCLTASGCSLGGCYRASTEFLKECLVGKMPFVDEFIPHPVYLDASCESLGFQAPTQIVTVPDACYGGFASFYLNDEDSFWTKYTTDMFGEWCPEWQTAYPSCYSSGISNAEER